MADIAAGIPQNVINGIVHSSLKVINPKSDIQHLAAAVRIEGEAEKALADHDIARAEELHLEADREFAAIEEED